MSDLERTPTPCQALSGLGMSACGSWTCAVAVYGNNNFRAISVSSKAGERTDFFYPRTRITRRPTPFSVKESLSAKA
jgi:hypothetical protein